MNRHLQGFLKQDPASGWAGGALFVLSEGRLAVRTRGVHPRNLSSSLSPRTIVVVSGTAPAETVTAPCLSPRDWAPKRSTGTNISLLSRFRQRTSSHKMSDWARREQLIPRKAD